MKYPYPLYDTVDFGNAANVETSLFTQAVGSSGKGKTITNMRGDGQLPSNESFTIQKIGFMVDDALALADYEAMWNLSYIEMLYNQVQVLIAPLKIFCMRNSFGGHFELSAAAAQELIGLEGDGYELPLEFLIKGGNQFRVNVFQGTALSAANLGMKVVLFGILDTGN